MGKVLDRFPSLDEVRAAMEDNKSERKTLLLMEKLAAQREGVALVRRVKQKLVDGSEETAYHEPAGLSPKPNGMTAAPPRANTMTATRVSSPDPEETEDTEDEMGLGSEDLDSDSTAEPEEEEVAPPPRTARRVVRGAP